MSNSDLLAWFLYLNQFKSSCNNTNVNKLNLLQFANSVITTILPTTTEQNQFLVRLATKYHFDYSIQDLTTYSTFKDLLNKKNPLADSIADILQMFAAPPLSTGTARDFWNALNSKAFPDGSVGSVWQKANAKLVAVMDKDCYTSAQQTQIAVLIDGDGKKISDVGKQIAVLG